MFKKKRRKSAGKRTGMKSYPFSCSGLYTDPVSVHLYLMFFRCVSLSGGCGYTTGGYSHSISGI